MTAWRRKMIWKLHWREWKVLKEKYVLREKGWRTSCWYKRAEPWGISRLHCCRQIFCAQVWSNMCFLLIIWAQHTHMQHLDIHKALGVCSLSLGLCCCCLSYRALGEPSLKCQGTACNKEGPDLSLSTRNSWEISLIKNRNIIWICCKLLEC